MPKYDNNTGRGIVRAEDCDVFCKKKKESRVQMHTEDNGP